MEKLKYRMYGFVPYNLSGRQAGIQNHHASALYGAKYNDAAYKQWALKDATVIMLDGGTTNNSKPSTMTSIVAELKLNNIKHVTFFEEDLNDALTGIALLVDSRVFDRKTYPGPFDFEEDARLKKLETVSPNERAEYLFNKEEEKIYKTWLKQIGGQKVAFLRYYLPKFKLASN